MTLRPNLHPFQPSKAGRTQLVLDRVIHDRFIAFAPMANGETMAPRGIVHVRFCLRLNANVLPSARLQSSVHASYPERLRKRTMWLRL